MELYIDHFGKTREFWVAVQYRLNAQHLAWQDMAKITSFATMNVTPLLKNASTMGFESNGFKHGRKNATDYAAHTQRVFAITSRKR